jgi:hypothetical protein
MAEVTPKTAHQTYQGTRSTAVRTGVETDEIVVVVDAMLSLCTFTIIALFGAVRMGDGAGGAWLAALLSVLSLPAYWRANISVNTEETTRAVFAGAVPSLRTRRCRSTALI